MRTASLASLAATLTMTSWLQVAAAQSPAPTTGAAVSPEADRVLKDMSAYLGSAQTFTFHADITFDHVLPSGQKLQFSASEDVALERPSGLYIEWSSDLGNRQFWYDGKSVTLYDPSPPFYASESAPAQLDGMLDRLLPQLNFSPPLADLMYSEPYKRVRNNIQYGIDLGTNDINGRSCRTFAFIAKDIDWQIWIDQGPQLTPCKLVITYRSLASQPQFSAVFTDWDFAPRIATPVFSPTLPPDARKIPFQTVTAAK